MTSWDVVCNLVSGEVSHSMTKLFFEYAIYAHDIFLYILFFPFRTQNRVIKHIKR